jgi:hypothetical protein
VQILGDGYEGVGVEELSGRDSKTTGQAQHIHRGEQDINVGAAVAEARQPRVTFETERLARG